MFKPGQVDRTAYVIARVDSKTITAADFDSIGEAMSVVIRSDTDVDSLKKVILDSSIDIKLIDIRVDSIVLELEHDRNFLEKRTHELANTVLRLMYQGEITGKTNIDSSQVVDEYSQNSEKYIDPAQIKASHVLIKIPPPDTFDVKSEEKMQKKFEDNRKETVKRAEAVYNKSISGGNWDSLVVKYSQDVTNNQKGGDLGYFPKGQMVPPFDSAAFNAEIGDIVGPVETRFGFHIIKIEDKKPESKLELDEDLFKKIKTGLSRAKEKEVADNFVDSLKTGARHVFNEEVLSQPDSLLDDSLWVVIVDDADTVFEQTVKKNFPKYLRRNSIIDWTAEDKKNMLKEISVNSLLRAAAHNLGYYNYPKAIQAKEEINRREAQMQVKHLLRNLEYQPTEEEVEKYYDEKFEERYHEKKPLHVQHIIFEDSALALVVRDSILAGADFKEMALHYYPGEKEIREVAYDLGYISDEELGQEFFTVANLLDVNDISLPFKTEWGHHLIKLVNRRIDKKLEQVRPGIRRALIEASDSSHRQEILDEWRPKSLIVEEEKALKKYKFPESLKSVEIVPKG